MGNLNHDASAVPRQRVSAHSTAVLEVLQEANCPTAVERIGWPDKFVEHGSSVEILRAAHGLAPDDLYRRVLDRWRHLNAHPVEAGA